MDAVLRFEVRKILPKPFPGIGHPRRGRKPRPFLRGRLCGLLPGKYRCRSEDAGDQGEDRQSALHQNNFRVACKASIKSDRHDISHQADDRSLARKNKYRQQNKDRKKAIIDA